MRALAQQLEDPRDDVVEVDLLARRALRVPEVDEVAHDGGDVGDFLPQLAHGFQRLGGAHARAQGGKVVVDDLQGIVDLVRHPRRKQAHGGQLLREDELLLQPVVLGDVLHEEDAADVRAPVEHGQRAQVVQSRTLPGPQGHVEELPLLGPAQGTDHLRCLRSSHLGEELGESPVLALGGGEAEGVLEVLVDQLHPLLRVHDQEAEGQVREDGLVVAQEAGELGVRGVGLGWAENCV